MLEREREWKQGEVETYGTLRFTTGRMREEEGKFLSAEQLTPGRVALPVRAHKRG